MKSTFPLAFFNISETLCSVSPPYVPTRSRRSTLITWPIESMPSDAYISPIRSATVVFPVPGFPKNAMCRGGIWDKIPSLLLIFIILTMLRCFSSSIFSFFRPIMEFSFSKGFSFRLISGISSFSILISCMKEGFFSRLNLNDIA